MTSSVHAQTLPDTSPRRGARPRLPTAALFLCGALASAATGCVQDPLNGTAVSGAVKDKAMTVSGFYAKPSIPIEVHVLKTPDANPAIEGNWEYLASVPSGTTQIHWNSTDPLYSFSVSVKPVPSNATPDQLKRWPSGKLVRLRAVAKDPTGDRTLTIFDSATYQNCFDDNTSKSWSDIGIACASPFSPLSVVSTNNNPADTGSGDFLSKKGDVTQGQTAQYYTSIGAPADMTAFKSKYGFPGGEFKATYYNDADLGFGREMHCRDLSPGVACYVKNFGNSTGAPNFPADPTSALALAKTGHGHFATVAMVYNPPSGGANSVKFIVYGPESKGEKLAFTAPLDSTGLHASIPNNCLSCHGISSTISFSSNPLPGTPVVSGAARFLPFDFYTFKFSTDPALTQAAQQDTFEKLNRLVSLTPMSSATSTFLKGMYGGVMPGGAGAYPTNRYVFPLWTENKTDLTMHEGVMKPFCRGCHMTSVNAALDFNDPAEFAGDYACNNTHPMPHAEHVLRRFWSSGARAYLSQRYNLQASGDCSQ